MIYEVFYEIIGSRCNGTYLVNAKSSAEAKKIVLAIDEDYVCRGRCVTKLGTFEKLSKLTHDEIWEHEDLCVSPEDIQEVKKEGSSYQLECGT